MENIQSYVKATIVLHNYLRQTENAIYCPTGFVDPEKRECFAPKINSVHGSRYKGTAVDMRNALKDYVYSEIGSLSW